MSTVDRPAPNSSPPLCGLVLCGGRGTRLGADKGALDYHGRPQSHWLRDLLAAACGCAFLSIRDDQRERGIYAGQRVVVDRPGVAGPAAGLLAAWDEAPDAAWLVVAADMPLIDEALLVALIRGRDPAAPGTAFRHPDGTPEPLCSIWEPRARDLVRAAPRFSLRDVLARCGAALLEPADAAQLLSVNTPEDDRQARALLGARRATREGGGY